jgi:soluble lytic murein transglycosylase
LKSWWQTLGATAEEQRQGYYWLGRSALSQGDAEAAIATLGRFLDDYPTDDLARPAQFNLGQAYQQNGQAEEAIATYLGSIIPDDPVNVYIYEIIGDLYLTTGAYTDTIAAYRTGIEATDDASFKVHLREGIAEIELLYKDDPAAAIAEYDAILNLAKIPDYRAKILKLRGDAYRLDNNESAALTSYQEAVDNYPQAYDSYLALVELVNAEQPVDEFQRGLIDYHAEAYFPAIDAFERYLTPPVTATNSISGTPPLSTTEVVSNVIETQTSPFPPPNADEALWLMALSWQALGQYNSAIFVFQQLIDDYPNSQYWGEAHVELGKTLINQENFSRGKERLRQFATRNPDNPFAPEALWRAARLEMDQDLVEDAFTSLKALAEQHPDSEYTPDALYWAGQMAYLQEDYKAAIDAWLTLETNYPASSLYSYAGYWRSRALSETGQQEEAEQLLKTLATDRVNDYYRLRARDRLTGELPDPVPLQIPDEARLSAERTEAEQWLANWLEIENTGNLSLPGDQLQQDSGFMRGRELLRFGLREQALVEFEAVKDRWWDDPLVMYQLANFFTRNQLGQLAILSAARVSFLSPAETIFDTPVYLQRLYYPFYFPEIIFMEAEQLEIDPALVASLIRQESLFEHAAESVVGARGLMQVMPGTGEYVAERSDFGDFDVDLLWYPYINIRFGAWYIHQQLAIFESNQFAAMAAYNAGPGNVLDWIETSDDLDIFVEKIPFWESRTYVRRVYENLAVYRHLYGIPPAEND